MKNETYHVIGVMSGTSLDGIDLAYLKFTKNQHWEYTFVTTQTIPYPDDWRERLQYAVQLSSEKLKTVDLEYTTFLSQIISDFMARNNIAQLDAICSHGHTILHRPEKGITLQIGNLPLLAKKLDQTVVCDFRKQDVDLGGQGAPLVPIGDLLLFPEYDFCLNLGGFANISTQKEDVRIAYDICPVNTVLNFYANKLGKAYDEGGKMAASGKVDPQLLITLDQLTYYQKQAPKSLGIEWVNEVIFPILKKSNLAETTILATFIAHISQQIAASIGDDPDRKCLITGGGVYNVFLLESIQNQTKTRIVVPGKSLIEYKEALIFGLLGILKLRNETNVLSSVTGAKKDHSSGTVWEG